MAHVDGFPAESDSAIHLIIDSELRNCLALEGTYAPPPLLYPAFFAAAKEETRGWLTPALHRLAWNSGKQPWTRYLTGLIQLLIPSPWNATPLSDETLLLLARLGPLLQPNDGGRDCEVNATVVANLDIRKGPMPAELIEAVRALVIHLIDANCHGPATFEIAWRLWRAAENPHDGDPCFSGPVRRDLRAMAKKESEAWSSLLDLRSKNRRTHSQLTPEQLGRVRKAVERIGAESFTSRWAGWVSHIESGQPAVLSAAGRELMVQVLQACGAMPELPIDDALYRLCGVRWAGEGKNLLTKEWIGTLLGTLSTRPPEKAFACAERLANNPDTSGFAEVPALYHQLLAEVMAEATAAGARVGVDGYELRCEPELFEAQVILDRLLQAAFPGANRDTALAATLRQASADPLLFSRAVTSRMRWLGQTRGSPGGVNKFYYWGTALAQLASQLLEAKPALAEADLIALIEVDTLGASGMASSQLLALVGDHTKSHGYSPALVRAMEAWLSSMHGSTSAMDIRHKIGWLLWFEDISPIVEQQCWANRIRKDLRAMRASSRAGWNALLENVSFTQGEKPPKKWSKPAGAAVAKIGGEDFRGRMRAWFEPFRAAAPLRITVTGRDILRNLMWYALVAKDPEVDEAVSWFATAQWKTKTDRSYITKLLPSFVYVMIERSPQLAHATLETFNRTGPAPLNGRSLRMYEELCGQLGQKPSVEAPPAPSRLKPDELMRAALARAASVAGMRVEGEQLVVKGVRDSYTIHLRDGRIVRQSDGRLVRLELDMSRSPLSPFRAMLDGADLQNPFGVNIFRAMMCAQILSRDDENAARIVADSD